MVVQIFKEALDFKCDGFVDVVKVRNFSVVITPEKAVLLLSSLFIGQLEDFLEKLSKSFVFHEGALKVLTERFFLIFLMIWVGETCKFT